MDACRYLGIYERQIEDAADTFDIVCKEFGIDAGKEWSKVDEQFKERFDIGGWSHFSNAVVEVMFWNLEQALIEKGIDRARIDYYINGELDTGFYIDGEEIA